MPNSPNKSTKYKITGGFYRIFVETPAGFNKILPVFPAQEEITGRNPTDFILQAL
jgi:hypothetical protein